jgi:hypothetical protein
MGIKFIFIKTPILVGIMGSLKRMQKLLPNAHNFGKWVKKKLEEEYGKEII